MSFVKRFLGSALAAATAVSVCAVAPPTAASPTRPGEPTFASAVRGLAPQVHPTAPASGHASAPAAAAPSKGARLRVPSGAARTAQAPSPQVAASRSTSTGTLLHDFNGVSSRDSEVTNFNATFEPPDQGLCAGNGFVLEAVNSAYSIYRPNGTVVRGPFNVNDLFDEGAAEFTSDPRCYFDPSTRRWFATILFLNSTFTEGRIDIAVSTTSDPTGLWRQYRIDATDPGGRGCPCFGDQPLLGIDHDNLYLSTNEFSILGPQFNGAQLYAVAKSDLVRGKASAHFVHFGDLTSGGSPAASVQPAITTGSPGAEYLLSSLDPDGTGDHRIDVWALSHGERVASGGMPVLTSKVVRSEPYAFPPPADQKGSPRQIDSGDDRMQQVQFINGRIWGELTTGVTLPGDTAEQAGAAWFAVRPQLAGDGRLTGGRVERQGYVTMPGNSVIYPALQADAAGRAAMVFTVTGSDRFPSAAFATLPTTGSDFGPVRVAAAGTGPYKAGTRWGDYSFAVLDPRADAVWLATEYVPPKASQTSTRQRNWGTRVLEVGLR